MPNVFYMSIYYELKCRRIFSLFIHPGSMIERLLIPYIYIYIYFETYIMNLAVTSRMTRLFFSISMIDFLFPHLST